MTPIWLSLAWIALILLAWIYVGYGLFLALISPRRAVPGTPDQWPSVSLLVMCYNEEIVIEQKLKNSLALDYPADKFEIMVVDSASTDRTVELTQQYSAQGVNLVQEGQRAGKASAISFGVQRASGDIIIITDANAEIESGAIKAAVRHFADPNVGGVTGAMEQRNIAKSTVSEQGSFYWTIEKILRQRESNLASVISMSGEFSVFRKKIILSEGRISDWYDRGGTDDFALSLYIISQGYRIMYEPEAVVWEPAPSTYADLAKRKVAIISQTIVSVRQKYQLLHPKYGWYSLIFLSRKILPLTSPWLLLLLLVSSAALPASPFWTFVFYAQLAFYALFILSKLRLLGSFAVLNVVQFFVDLNWMVIRAWIAFWRKKDYTVWEKVMSSRINTNSRSHP